MYMCVSIYVIMIYVLQLVNMFLSCLNKIRWRAAQIAFNICRANLARWQELADKQKAVEKRESADEKNNLEAT